MSVPSHLVKVFKTLEKTSTFVQLRTEFMASVQGDIEEFLQIFHHLPSNQARVTFLHEKLQEKNLLEDKFLKDGKDDEKATSYREKGSRFFGSGKYPEALQFYTKSIAKAESSEALAVAYGYRSAALFKLNLIEAALIDIERALSYNYPAHLKPNLVSRRDKLLKIGNLPKFRFYEPPPYIQDDQKNPAVPSASACIEIKVAPSAKKRVFASRDIEIGEVLAVEKPISFIVGNADFYHCHNCYELCYSLIPCNDCCEALYCGDSCKEEASINYHKKECQILLSLKKLVGKHKACLLAIKLSFLTFDGNQREDLEKLEANIPEDIRDETFTMALVAALTFHLVKTHTKTFETESLDTEQFKDSLMKHLKICIFYGAGIEELYPNALESGARLGQELLNFKSETVGCGIYPLYSLFGHSCCPNVFAHQHGLNRVLRAVRSIKAGDECVVSYGPYYVEHGRDERQSRLSSQYHFSCLCKACEENWPQLDLKPYYLKTEEDLMFMSEIRDANIDAAYRGIPRFVAKIKELEHLEPCSDLTLQQKLLSYCYDVLGNKRHIV